jgi:hypothetical protein
LFCFEDKHISTKQTKIEKSCNNPTSWELSEEKLGFRFKEAQLSIKNSCQIIEDLMSKAGTT